MTRKKINILWLFFLVVWPLSLWASYHFYMINIEGQIIEILFFVGLTCIVSLFSIVTNTHTIFFIHVINIVVFLVYGLFMEIIIAQLSILIVVIHTGILKRESFRLPLNMLLFLFLSIICAELFYFFGGHHDLGNYQDIRDIFPVIIYALSLFVINQILRKLMYVYVDRRKVNVLDKGLGWEFITLLITLPMGFILYLLYSFLDKAGIIIVGIPFIFISIILKALYSYQEVNYYLKQAGEIGHQLTRHLKVQTIYDVFVENIIKLLGADHVYIYRVVNQSHLELVQFADKQGNHEARFNVRAYDEDFSRMVWSTSEPITFRDSKEWEKHQSLKVPKQTESVLSLPIAYGTVVIGVVTITSSQKHIFEKIHDRFLNIVINYLGVAITNAKNLENVKKEGDIDGLTQLYNYEYFDHQLEEYSYAVQNNCEQGPLSLILLDLDHFKAVNDHFGHEAGNEVLYEVAKRLKEKTKGMGTLARYGGEEFILLLPGVDVVEAMEIAESIRLLIATKPFIIQNHFLQTNDVVEVSLTTSVGVASYPLHCESPTELVRHADRAMYAGAKNKGRNKVATYEKMVL